MRTLGAGLLRGTLRALPQTGRGPAVRTLLHVLPRRLRGAVVAASSPVVHPDDHLPITAGPLAGTAWIVGSSVPDCLFGAFAPAVTAALCAQLHAGAVAYDVGANAGYFTLLASKLVGPNGRVVAVEPFPGALTHLRRHVHLNRAENAHVLEAALADHVGVAGFTPGPDSSTGKLDAAGSVTVAVTTLDALLDAGSPAPDVVKVDVEGSEVQVLRGGERTLREHAPALVIALHGRDRSEECGSFLEQLAYKLTVLEESGLTADAYRAEVLAVRTGVVAA